MTLKSSANSTRGEARLRRPAARCVRGARIPAAHRGGLGFAAMCVLAAAGAPPASAGEPPSSEHENCLPDEPAEYRLATFRAPTPCTLRNATVVHTDGAARLAAAGKAVLIDVVPAPRRPQTIGADELWFPPERMSLPGCVWLPNTGFGVLPAEEENYLRDYLARLSAGKKSAPLVFFCESDCWMSWNAAKRAMAWGYERVYWYPGGTDAWALAGLPLEQATPAERGETH